MYYIEKIPTPRGYKILEKKVPVSQISGVDKIYAQNDELKGEYTELILDGQIINLKIIYTLKYNDNSEREFVTYEQVGIDNRFFSLSSVPIVESPKRYVTEIKIKVSKE